MRVCYKVPCRKQKRAPCGSWTLINTPFKTILVTYTHVFLWGELPLLLWLHCNIGLWHTRMTGWVTINLLALENVTKYSLIERLGCKDRILWHYSWPCSTSISEYQPREECLLSQNSLSCWISSSRKVRSQTQTYPLTAGSTFSFPSLCINPKCSPPFWHISPPKWESWCPSLHVL